MLSPTLPQGYEIHEIPIDYTGKVWIEGQLRQFANATIEYQSTLPDTLAQYLNMCILGDATDKDKEIMARVLANYYAFKDACG